MGRRRRARHASDGRVILVRRDRARALAPEPQPDRAPARRCTTRSSITCARPGVVPRRDRAGGRERGGAPRPRAGSERARASGGAARPDRRRAVGPGVGRRGHQRHVRAAALARPAGRRAGRRARHASAAGGRWSSRSARPATADRAGARAGDGAARALGDRRPRRPRAPTTCPAASPRLADVLRAMEDAGTVRRGYFVESLTGAQFAWPGAIDRLREAPRGQAAARRRARGGRSGVRVGQRPALAARCAIRRRGRPAGSARPRSWSTASSRCGSSRGPSGSRPASCRPRRSSSRSRSACRAWPRARVAASCWSS